MFGEACRRCLFDAAYADGLCRPCYQFRYRTGRDRPIEKILRHIDRTLNREALLTNH